MEPGWALVIEKEKIVFECENKYNENKIFQSEFNGLGNDLIKKRIDLMYPKKHNLAITKENDIYKVNLALAND